MPELPEVEAICRKIAPKLRGRRIAAVEVVRPGSVSPQPAAEFIQLAAGRKITDVARRGKNILLHLSGGFAVRIHLRMTGRLAVSRDGAGPATRIRFALQGGEDLLFNDPRALGRAHVYTEAELEEEIGGLGPEPLSEGFTPEALIEAASRSRLPAKVFLMDQTRIAGLGNIYAAEALFRAGIHPARPMNRLSRQRLLKLHCAILEVLREAVESARIAYTCPGEVEEAETFSRFVYGREGEPCIRCRRRIRRIPQGGRSTYFCPGCQK